MYACVCVCERERKREGESESLVLEKEYVERNEVERETICLLFLVLRELP